MTAEIPKIEIISDKEHIGSNKEEQVGWRQDRDAFVKGMKALQESSRTHGIIPKLQPHFMSLKKQGKTSMVYLCSPDTDHVATGLMDLGWGCGYRNCQMLMTFLSKQRDQNVPILDGVVNIKGLQLLLENAWKEGFDPAGAAQLEHRVYKTHKWIGTTEVYTMLAYLGIRCTILDFDRPTGTNNSHDAMFDWIQSYFEEGCSEEGKLAEADARQQQAGKHKDRVVHITNRPPIYLQHSGHSRTIIGIEILSDGKRNLVMFDPGRRMARSYKKNVSVPEDDMYNSGLLSLNNDEENTSTDTPPEELPDGWLSKMRNLFTVPASNLLRPFRVDSNSIASNPQYQLLVLGEVNELKIAAPTHQCLRWNPDKSFLLSSEEREQNKKIGSFRVV
ncbi:hypothetical protein K450DRAFT_250105 [Umbelopsis ramanniana AG]|uniref:UFSP1/2/DUB catalytic domain-containing protein n=1 Tax=Umbelopsis ramanniana AG TaxID=1314678 RepID=A0AAD5E6R0_UMBRA|nr:uncharacterized protein K450DRAFT_250105 [Umbelopsis ramanniana AG]KAI8577809.1 hypothetical protein K450DRAFT_250105 [Umbelopsis ramanniana AG]